MCSFVGAPGARGGARKLQFCRRQYRQLARLSRERFEFDAWQHVGAHFGDRVSAIGEERSRALLRFALDEAARFGFTLQRDVLRYVNLVFEFGPSFPADPRFAWATYLLQEDEDAPLRMDRLYSAALARVR